MSYAVWFLPLLSGVADASYRIAIKNSKFHSFILNAWGFLFTLPYYFIWLMVLGIPAIQSLFWITISLSVPLGIMEVILQVKAHRLSPLGLTTPYLSLTPAYSLVITPLLSYVFPVLNRSWPNVFGGIGVLVLTFGIYILNLQGKGADLLAPFRQLKKERGSLYMLMVGFLWSVTGNLDFVGMQQSNPAFYVVVLHGLISAGSFILAGLYIKRGLISPEEKSGLGLMRIAFIYGTAVALSMIFHLSSFLWISEVPYVIAAKRAGTMIFVLSLGLAAVIMGRFKVRFSDEKENLGWKALGTALMFTGMLIVMFYGRDI